MACTCAPVNWPLVMKRVSCLCAAPRLAKLAGGSNAVNNAVNVTGSIAPAELGAVATVTSIASRLTAITPTGVVRRLQNSGLCPGPRNDKRATLCLSLVAVEIGAVNSINSAVPRLPDGHGKHHGHGETQHEQPQRAWSWHGLDQRKFAKLQPASNLALWLVRPGQVEHRWVVATAEKIHVAIRQTCQAYRSSRIERVS